MRLAFFRVKQKQAEIDLAKCLEQSGVSIVWLDSFNDRCACDAYCVVGVKHHKVVKALECEGLPYLFWDKGYNRLWSDWWRVTYSSYQPTAWLMSRPYSQDRMIQQGWHQFEPWVKRPNGYILFAGASPKYHVYHDLPTTTNYMRAVMRRIRAVTDRPVMYRPRVNPGGIEEIDGCISSPLGAFADDLEGASVLITHGSSACLDALFAGVPSIVLGDGVARPISSVSLDDVERPRLASVRDRMALLSGLAHFQWCKEEIRKGKPWLILNSIMRNSTCGRICGVLNGGQAV